MVYHVDVFMPDAVYHAAALCLCRLGGTFTLSLHAMDRVREKGIVLPERIPIGVCTIIEVTGHPLEKFLVRFPMGEKDIVMALTATGKVTTCLLYTSDAADDM
jgi:hypothetical protein